MVSFERVTSDRRPMPPAVHQTLRRYKELLEGGFGTRLAELRLFGPFPWQDADGDGRVEVLVVVRDLTEKDRDRAIALAHDARSELEWVDLCPSVYSTDRIAELRALDLLRAIDTEGIAL